MNRWRIPIGLGAAMITILLGSHRLAPAQESADGAGPVPPRAEPALPSYTPPAYSSGAAALAYTAPVRAYRRGAVPAFGVYVGPRAVYSGTLAPWGSIPARFYAASYPLPLFALAPGASLSLPYGHAVTPYRPKLEPQDAQSPSLGRSPTPGPFAPEANSSAAAPESVPAPQPFDMPEPDASSGETPEAAAPPPTPRPPAPPSRPRRSENGPREF